MDGNSLTRWIGVGAGALAAGFTMYKMYTVYLSSQTSSLFQTSGSGDNEYTHMDPDMLDAQERKELNTQFSLASAYMKSRHARALPLSNEDKLRLYAYYKQCSVGPNKTPRPSLLDFERTAMWNAWSELNGVNSVEAMIAYVELVHKLDPSWREKVTSKALSQVLGENGTMECDPSKVDSDEEDEGDKLFEQQRMKSAAQLDAEHEQRIKEKKLREKEEKQRLYREKFLNGASVCTNETEKSGNTQNKDVGGPVFSSTTLATDVPQQDLEVGTIAIGASPDTQNATSINDTKTDLEEISTQKDSETCNEPKNSSDDRTMASGNVYIRVFDGDFGELTQIDDIDVFEAILIRENKLAIASQNPDFDLSMYPDDDYTQLQKLFAQFKVIMVDLNRVTLLHQVAETGTASQMLVLLIKYHYPVDLPNSSGNTSLMLAVGNENVDVVKVLLQNGAQVNDEVLELVDLSEDQCIKDQLTTIMAPYISHK